jgi:ligand-binding SRPBCC domain-containing protein
VTLNTPEIVLGKIMAASATAFVVYHLGKSIRPGASSVPLARQRDTPTIRFHTLRREQWIPRPISEVAAFFSDARNLAEITPFWMAFRILTPGPIRMEAGTQIRYRLSWHGVPVSWTTAIRRWDPPDRFVDVQSAGPYALWHHTHRFEAKDGGTLMTDIIRYRLPFGIAGRIVHRLKVRGDLEAIFEYRRKRVEELFGAAPLAEAR